MQSEGCLHNQNTLISVSGWCAGYSVCFEETFERSKPSQKCGKD